MQPLHVLLGFVHATYQVDARVQTYQFGAGCRPYDTLDGHS